MSNTEGKKTLLSQLLEERKLQAVKVDPNDSYLLNLLKETQQDQAASYDLKRIDEEVLGLVVQF